MHSLLFSGFRQRRRYGWCHDGHKAGADRRMESDTQLLAQIGQIEGPVSDISDTDDSLKVTAVDHDEFWDI